MLSISTGEKVGNYDENYQLNDQPLYELVECSKSQHFDEVDFLLFGQLLLVYWKLNQNMKARKAKITNCARPNFREEHFQSSLSLLMAFN